METIELNPDQIITLNDYPLYSNKVLNEYFDKCKLGTKVPLVPAIKKDIVRGHFGNELLKKFEQFEEKNQMAEFFMLDGSHRTTALTLAGCKITAIIYEKDDDIREARKLVETGQILENETLNHTLKENCEILDKHFKEKPYFVTVEQKVKRMIQENYISQYMLKS